MAKVTDLNLVQQRAQTVLGLEDYDIVGLIGLQRAVWCLVAIYTTNDICKGYGQDFAPKNASGNSDILERVSVISFENGVSVIVGSESSRYQDSFPMCGYTDLDEDLYEIAICIQAAIDRLNAQ